MDYNQLLDEWAEEVYSKADKAREESNYTKVGSYKHGLHVGYADGLIMAVTLLSKHEKRHEKLVEPN